MFDPALLQHIQHLARLGASPDEAERLARDVGAILEHFQALSEVDVSDAPEWTSALEEDGTPADDEPRPWPRPRETLLTLTEHAREGFYVVPAILDRPPPGAPPAAGVEPARPADAPVDPDPADDEDTF